MNKTVKIIILVLVLAVAAYFGYKWYCKKKEAANAALKTPAPAPKVDGATNLGIVRDMSNGLNVDLA